MGMDYSVGLRAVSDVRMACGTCATRLSLEQKLGWKEIKVGNVSGEQTQEGIKEGRGGGVTWVVIFREVWRV